jgi:hypothetical protein
MAGLFVGVFLDARRFSLPFLLVLEFLARLDGHFATRSLARDCPIELNADKVWAGTGDTGSAKTGQSPHRRTGDRKRLPSSTAAIWALAILCQIRQKRLTLARIAEPGIGPVAGRAKAVSMACGDPAADPYSRCRSGQRVGPGAAIWKNALLGASRRLTSRTGREWASMRAGQPFGISNA